MPPTDEILEILSNIIIVITKLYINIIIIQFKCHKFFFIGMKFSHKKYLIVLTAGSNKGPVAKIKVEASTSSISYSITGARSLVDINNSGKLKLMKNLNAKIASALNNTEITIVASKQGTSEKASTIVIIIILPLYFGDQYIPQIAMEEDSSVKEKQSQYKHITARVLLRFLRRPSQTARRIALAQLKLETKIMKIKKMIIKRIGKQTASENPKYYPFLLRPRSSISCFVNTKVNTL